jgi:metal-responsive CopG/Arc/MetJ family transcriptional regulator
MKRTSLFLDDKLLKALRRAAAREGVSVASIVREAVSRYLAEPEKPGAIPSIAGRFGSGKHDTANDTDRFLWRDPHA